MQTQRVRLLVLAFWLVPAIVATVGFQVVPSLYNPDIGVAAVFACQIAMWMSWGVWSLIILDAGNRFPFRRGALLAAFAVHALLCTLVVTAQILVAWVSAYVFGLGTLRHLDSMLAIGLRSYGDTFTVIFWGIVGAQVSFRWYAAWREQTLLMARLGQDLAEAQLRALQSQLNPHFLFNALNSVVTLIGRDQTAAQKMVVRLADLLRATLRAGEAQEITLRQELEVTERYLEVEQVRFADRLRVHWSVEPSLEAIVPAFALQPLVENALVHGIARRSAAGEISVAATREGEALVLRVRDNGPGPHAEPARRDGGVGLGNLRARLARLYGGDAGVELSERPEGGTEAVLRVPFRVAPAPPPEASFPAGDTTGRGTSSRTVGASVVPARRVPSSSNFSH